MTKRTFVLQWDSKLGPMWMNEYNLRSCLQTDAHVGDGVVVVEDITAEPTEVDECDVPGP